MYVCLGIWIDWENLEVEEKGETTEISHVPRQELCSDDEKRTVLIDEELLYADAVKKCAQLGGQLSIEWRNIST